MKLSNFQSTTSGRILRKTDTKHYNVSCRVRLDIVSGTAASVVGSQFYLFFFNISSQFTGEINILSIFYDVTFCATAEYSQNTNYVSCLQFSMSTTQIWGPRQHSG